MTHTTIPSTETRRMEGRRRIATEGCDTSPVFFLQEVRHTTHLARRDGVCRVARAVPPGHHRRVAVVWREHTLSRLSGAGTSSSAEDEVAAAHRQKEEETGETTFFMSPLAQRGSYVSASANACACKQVRSMRSARTKRSRFSSRPGGTVSSRQAQLARVPFVVDRAPWCGR